MVCCTADSTKNRRNELPTKTCDLWDAHAGTVYVVRVAKSYNECVLIRTGGMT